MLHVLPPDIKEEMTPAPKFTLWTSLLLPRAGALPVFDFGAG